MEKILRGGMIAIGAFIVAAAYGWIANIVTLVHVINNPITALTVARIAGIFVVPLGVVLGYM